MIESEFQDDGDKLSHNNKERNLIWFGILKATSSLSAVGVRICTKSIGTSPFMGWGNSMTTLTGTPDPIIALLSYKVQSSS